MNVLVVRYVVLCFFFFKQKTAYEIGVRLVGSEMCIRDRTTGVSNLTAHACSSAGFLLLTVLPEVMDPFAGILLSVIVYAVGGGIIEVLISPIMESSPP